MVVNRTGGRLQIGNVVAPNKDKVVEQVIMLIMGNLGPVNSSA